MNEINEWRTGSISGTCFVPRYVYICDPLLIILTFLNDSGLKVEFWLNWSEK